MMTSEWKEALLGQSGQNARGDTELENLESSTAVNLKFLKRIWGLMCIARCGDSFFLILLSVVEVIISSQAGLIVGHFYNSLISKNSKCGGHMPWDFKWAAEWLAIGWRKRLTQRAHGVYCSGPILRRLSQRRNSLDNPDERITNEINVFCENVAQLMLKTIAAPLMILYYTWWVAYHVGWFGPLIVYAFFAAGAMWIRWIISPIAAFVARQERLKAVFRISHVRFHGSAEAIAMSNGAAFEKRKLEENLAVVLLNKKKLVLRHFLLAVNTKLFDYLGMYCQSLRAVEIELNILMEELSSTPHEIPDVLCSMSDNGSSLFTGGVLNYSVLAIPVFAGVFDAEDSGELANLISNASFSVLQLIYSFSQVIDTAKLVSDLAGHTSRVGEFFEDLETLTLGKEAFLNQDDAYSTKDEVALRETYLIRAPVQYSFPGGRTMQFSIHFSPPILHKLLERLCPRIVPASLLIVPVFERTDVGKDEEITVGETSKNFSGMLTNDSRREKFSELLFQIKGELDRLGHWTQVLDESLDAFRWVCLSNQRELEVTSSRGECDFTGNRFPVTSLQNARSGIPFPEDVVKVLLGYNCSRKGPKFVLSHPTFGENFLLSFVLSAAPINVLRSVLDTQLQETACAPPAGGTEKIENELLPSVRFIVPTDMKAYELPTLAMESVTCFFPGTDKAVFKNLSLHLYWGESLLVMGPVGGGKTSFLRALCGLWPLDSGEIRCPSLFNSRGILVLSQKTILAPAGLGGQISYPEPFSASENLSSLKVSRLWNSLEGVGMTHLLTRCNDNWEVELDWTKVLSPGEQQSVALARVLYHRPQFVILDEATSAISEDVEYDFYQRLLAMGISIISVSHRSRLIRHHTKLLVLAGDGSGGWATS